MAPVYSHSRLSSFENCPKQFHFRYVLRVPVETEGIEAFAGKLVHAVLERLHQFVGAGQVPRLDRVLQRFHADWDERYDSARIRIARGDGPEGYRHAGEQCLRNYYRRHYPFDDQETLGLERRVRFTLDPEGRYRMQGVIDRIARAPDGAIEIQDYKTSRRIPRQSALDRDRQLALYQLALRDELGDGQPVRLVWHFLLHDQVRTSTRSDEELAELGARTRELIDRIEREERYEARPSALCGWCEYREQCPASGAMPEAPRASSPPAVAAAAAPTAAPARPADSAAPDDESARKTPAGTAPERAATRRAGQLGLFS